MFQPLCTATSSSIGTSSQSRTSAVTRSFSRSQNMVFVPAANALEIAKKTINTTGKMRLRKTIFIIILVNDLSPALFTAFNLNEFVMFVALNV